MKKVQMVRVIVALFVFALMPLCCVDQVETDYIISQVCYVKDPRTGLCFARSNANINFGLTTVPCQAVHPDMLAGAYRAGRSVGHIVSQIRYIKDARTGLCFAKSGSVTNFGLTTVPCQAVPHNMLMVGGSSSK